jgi:hypothetical protein
MHKKKMILFGKEELEIFWKINGKLCAVPISHQKLHLFSLKINLPNSSITRRFLFYDGQQRCIRITCKSN